ncbi:DUF1295 domain-containing protein [Puniceicoccaceae bacterium K14]|nr:DUF1295 domain-containing protein [Puniceicoccaceae bacterium K14]
MKTQDRNTLFATFAVLLLGFGLAVAGSDRTVTIFLAPTFAVTTLVAFAIQWIVFIPSYLKSTEKYFDLTGSLTFVSISILSISVSGNFELRRITLFLMVMIWATRLGTYLFQRMHKAGKDRRFDALKKSPVRFLCAWTLQGLWVTFTSAAAVAAITSSKTSEVGSYYYLGTVLWIAGFAIEAIADRQKKKFSSVPQNKGRFIQSGLWSRSRHPNYFGEILLWLGVAVVAYPLLQGWQLITLLSPVLVAILLIYVSGIPLLERSSDEKWGDQPDYQEYKSRTPVLLLRLW